MVVCNLSYVRARWPPSRTDLVSKEKGAASGISLITASKLKLSAIQDAWQVVQLPRTTRCCKAPTALTMSFIVVMAISAIGFHYLWILSSPKPRAAVRHPARDGREHAGTSSA